MSLTTFAGSFGSSGEYLTDTGYIETTHEIIHERDVSYRFYLHQHPYVQQLVQRLIRESTSGLQAADTEYDPKGASLPDSVELTLPANANVTVNKDARIALLGDVIATTTSGQIQLAAGLAPTLAEAGHARVPNGMAVMLVAGLADTPPKGSTFQLEVDQEAVVFDETTVRLRSTTAIVLPDGEPATIPSGTFVRLAAETPVILPGDLRVELKNSKPRPTYFSELFDKSNYQPAIAVRHPYPVADLDFTSSGAYSVYNWELFFHVPFTIAVHLSKNQRFAEAQRWFHYLFDPTDNSDGENSRRFWKVRPFQETDVRKIEEILVNLATGTDPTLYQDTLAAMRQWQDAPFRPHVIARFRQQAYMYKTVMAYLDNLIAWGDSLFRQDTGEAIDEAMMVYVLAANILGQRPQVVPRQSKIRPQTYENLRHDIREFGVVIRDIEASLALSALPPGTGGADERAATLRSLSQSLYFCVPHNQKLIGYWDTVADRLFKIRNSLNFQGVFRQLALFEPPIDPAMLARAAAAGLDVGAIVNGLNQPLPHVRFQLLVQKAAEICQEVKSLGSNLLSAMEKEDGEAMAILRAKHERVVMDMVEQMKYAQAQEATKSKEGLLQTLALAVHRYTYYEMQLGKKADEIEKAIPGWDELDKDSLEKMKFKMKEAGVALRDIEVDIATDVAAQAAQALNGGKLLSSHEVVEAILLETAQEFADVANILNVAGSVVAAAMPDFHLNASPWGVGGGTGYGGQNLAAAFSGLASAARGAADRANFEARRAARIDSFARREREWAFQSNLAAGEISQIFKQLRAAEIREAIAELELKNHRKQMEHAEEIEHFLNEEGANRTGKTTNKSLYTWMKREVKGLYAQCFQLAFDIAKKAERALQHELGNMDLSYVQFGYLAGKEGLLAGEKLYFDLKRMEMAYHDLNQREYELTKHVSLLQLNPMALIQLRTTGHCTVSLPESMFDMDGPGHYFRRIKTVALTIPCVTGPYAGVNCTLTLLKSSIRKTQQLIDDTYARVDAEDTRFSDNFGSLQSIVTSSAQNDSGLFETNLRDERYLPFENSGAISEWQLDLPANPSKGDPAQFDYNTISDVILHVRYTAREGGGLLRNAAIARGKQLIGEAQAAGSVRLFTVRHEFPTQWAQFQSQAPGPGELTLNLRAEHYPFWSADRLNQITRIDLLVRSTSAAPTLSVEVFGEPVDLIEDPSYGDLFVGHTAGAALPGPVGEFKLLFDANAMADLWIAVAWSE